MGLQKFLASIGEDIGYHLADMPNSPIPIDVHNGYGLTPGCIRLNGIVELTIDRLIGRHWRIKVLDVQDYITGQRMQWFRTPTTMQTLRPGCSDMNVVNPELCLERQRRIGVGTKGFFVESALRTDSCAVGDVFGLCDA